MSSTQPTLLCRYRYDPLDKLINQNKPDQPTHQRFYCKSRLATEIQGAIQHSIVQHGDQLLAQRERQGDVVDTTLLATDLQRSVLQTLKANHQRQPIAYSPYGHRPAENGLLSLLGFNGERRDLVTGYYLLGNGYRAFNPVLMRFNSPDSWSPFGRGGLNSYAYCLSDPINRSDPHGHSFLDWVNVTFRNKIKINGKTEKILPHISAKQAINARSEIKQLQNKISILKESQERQRNITISADTERLSAKFDNTGHYDPEYNNYLITQSIKIPPHSEKTLFSNLIELQLNPGKIILPHDLPLNKNVIKAANLTPNNGDTYIRQRELLGAYLEKDISEYLKNIREVGQRHINDTHWEMYDVLFSNFKLPRF